MNWLCRIIARLRRAKQPDDSQDWLGI